MTSIEKLLPLAKAVEMATGVRAHPVSIWRWSTKGIRGVKLETRMLGGRRMTSIEAVTRFVEQTSAPRDQPEFNPTIPKVSSRAAKAAEQLRQMVSKKRPVESA